MTAAPPQTGAGSFVPPPLDPAHLDPAHPDAERLGSAHLDPAHPDAEHFDSARLDPAHATPASPDPADQATALDLATRELAALDLAAQDPAPQDLAAEQVVPGQRAAAADVAKGADAAQGAAGQMDDPSVASAQGRRAFHVRLDNFDGPFDLLLQLINQRRMDVTDVALHQVTDDFIGHIRSMGTNWDLDQVTEFLVIAATLLDLKASRLLPNASADDSVLDDDIFQARDLLFARLLAYRAYQQVAALFAELEAGALRRYPRAVTLESRYLGLLPEITIGMTPEQFAAMAAAVFTPKPPPTVNLDHIHASPVSVAEHTAAMRAILTNRGTATFGELVAGCSATLEIVARFLGLLNLYRESAVAFDQPEPLGTLTVRWTLGTANGSAPVGAVASLSPTDEEYE
jgi:segregation and condensation protein A